MVEERDCTVRAVALTASISYREAHSILKKAGRKNGHTFKFRTWAENGFGPIADRMQRLYEASLYNSRLTVNQFMKKNLKGRYMVRVSRHVFAVIDGVLHDLEVPGGKKRILNIWRLEEKC